jgi:hypothetical protein
MIDMQFKLRNVIVCISLALIASPEIHAQVDVKKLESHLIGRWVVDAQNMCVNPKFTGAGIFYYYDKSGKLINELRLPGNGQIQVVRRSVFKNIEEFDQSNSVYKTTAQSENLQNKSNYLTVSLIQFSEDFHTMYLLDQSMDGVFNIRDSVVLATRQKQSPFFKCE